MGEVGLSGNTSTFSLKQQSKIRKNALMEQFSEDFDREREEFTSKQSKIAQLRQLPILGNIAAYGGEKLGFFGGDLDFSDVDTADWLFGTDKDMLKVLKSEEDRADKELRNSAAFDAVLLAFQVAFPNITAKVGADNPFSEFLTQTFNPSQVSDVGPGMLPGGTKMTFSEALQADFTDRSTWQYVAENYKPPKGI